MLCPPAVFLLNARCPVLFQHRWLRSACAALLIAVLYLAGGRDVIASAEHPPQVRTTTFKYEINMDGSICKGRRTASAPTYVRRWKGRLRGWDATTTPSIASITFPAFIAFIASISSYFLHCPHCLVICRRRVPSPRYPSFLSAFLTRSHSAILSPRHPFCSPLPPLIACRAFP